MRIPLVHLVLVLVHLVLVLVSSSCNLENREREEESGGGGAGSVGSSSTLYFAATSLFFIVLQVLQFIIHEFSNYFYLHSSYLLDSRLHQVL